MCYLLYRRHIWRVAFKIQQEICFEFRLRRESATSSDFGKLSRAVETLSRTIFGFLIIHLTSSGDILKVKKFVISYLIILNMYDLTFLEDSNIFSFYQTHFSLNNIIILGL